jgi:fatty-acyl-CoA synthase
MLQERLDNNIWCKSTVQALFYENCEILGDKSALWFEEKIFTYRELRHRVNTCAQALLKLGVKKGDHVLMIPTNIPEFVTIYFATLQVGALINPLNYLWGVIEYTGVIQRNDPVVLVTIDQHANRDYIKILKETIPDLKINAKSSTVSSKKFPTLKHLISVSRQGKKHEGYIDFNDLMKTGEDYVEEEMAALVAKGKNSDVQFICQSSGSTGLSKGSLWTHNTPLAVAHCMVQSLCYRDNGKDSYILITPICHASGLCSFNLALVLTGTCLYMLESFDPKKAIELIDRFKITATFGFDAHFQGMKKVFDSGNYEFTLHKLAVAVTPNTYDMVQDEMCKTKDTNILSLFGQSECGGLLCLTEPTCIDENIRRNANGRPFGGVQIVIKDIITGAKIPPDKLGEICYKSPHLFRGYYRQEEETKKQFDDEGYFHSGDYGTFEGGYLYFHGRLGGVVKTGGENVSTAWVSKNLLDIFSDVFDDVQTVGVPDPYWGTKLVSWVRLMPGKSMPSLDDVKKACKGKMAGYEIPKEILLWSTPWPVNPVGKVDVKILEVEANKALGIKS